MSAPWPARLAALGAVVTALYVGLEVFDYEPRLLRLALLVTVCVAVVWLIVDVLGDLGPNWQVQGPSSLLGPGQDARLSTYLRVLEGHLTSHAPDEALRDRLAQLADKRLAQRYGLDRIDPEGRSRVGPELLGVLEGPLRRLSVAEIDRHLHRIEEL